MREKNQSVAVFGLIASLLMFYLLNRVVMIYDQLDGDLLQKINDAIKTLIPSLTRQPFMVGTTRRCLIGGVVGFVSVWMILLYHVFGAKNFMRGKEYGAARWGTPRDIRPLMNPDPDLNIPLSATEQISITTLPNFEADRNKNIVIVGGSGSGKTYAEIKPSLMQLHSSYIVTDPKGTILPATGYMLKKAQYRIRVFNTIDFSKSLHYNPLSYIKKEKDILKVVNVLMENTNGEGNQSGDKFWKDCERLLYTAFIAYLCSEAPEEANIPTMIDMLERCAVKEDDEEHVSAIDILFEELEKNKPDCLAVKQYRKFKTAAGKTMKSILISCAARLAPFDIAELREITMFDELKLDEIGDHRTAFFVIMSDTDSAYSFLISMIMYQMFNLLCEKADNEYGGALPFHVRCLLDEFANCGKIPDFERLISTVRSRNISCTLVLQSLAQLSSVYKDNAETIIDCCDTFIFLGGKSTKTTKQVSEMVGKTTIDVQNVNESKGQSGNYSLNNSILGRDLIDSAEVGRLKRAECIVLITGLPSFKSKKYDTNKHKRFKEISDGGAPIYNIQQIRKEQDQEFFEHARIVSHYDCSELNKLN